MEFAEEKRYEMLEAVSMFDEQLMEDLLEEKEITVEAIHEAVLKGVNSLDLTPVYFGSAFKNKSVQPITGSRDSFVLDDA